MRRHAWVWIGLAAAAVPRIADACSFPCGLWIERPLDGEPHPANAALHIPACDTWVETLLTVTVDGEPATFVPAVPISEPAYDRVAISPAPAPGQEIVIHQCGEDAAMFGCPEPAEPFEVLRYIAGPVDLEPPQGAGSVVLTHTFGPTKVPCHSEGDVEFHAEVSGLDQGDETAVLYIIDLDTQPIEGYADGRVVQWVGPEAVTTLSVDFSQWRDHATVPPEDTCVTVTAIDLAGNTSIVATACGSTATNAPPDEGDSSDGDSSGGDSSDGDSSGGSPSTTAATTSDEPPIDATTTGEASVDAGAADGDGIDRGCACAATPASTPGLLPLVVVVAAFVRSRPASRTRYAR